MAGGDRERNPVEYLAEEFLERRRRGEETSIDEYAKAHPEQSSEIRALFPTILEMEEFKEKRIGAVSLDVEQLSGLKDFRIIREIGRGGMGVVYEAEQQSLGRRVALKVLPPRSVSQGSRSQRFENEARAAARLHHTNIVPVFGTGEHDGCHFYVMQYIPGLSLDRVLATLRGDTEHPSSQGGTEDLQTREVVSMLLRDRLAGSVEDSRSSGKGERATERAPEAPASYSGNQKYYRSIARIGVQVAGALQYAHGQGTLHRDIKPANLLLDGHGTVWVTDFGLAKTVEQAELTQSGDIVGTLGYMAPEQAHGQFDARSDVYSLGLTLYELIAMRPANSGQGDVLDRLVHGRLPSLRTIDPNLPRDLATIIEKACSPDPAHRYTTAADLEEDLHRFLDERPILARKVSVLGSMWRWSRRNRAMAFLAASTILAIIAAGVSGWIGYGMTTSALSREQVATDRAEANLSLSLEAFDDIFNQISGPDPFQSVLEDPDSGEFAAVTSTPISLEDAELLDRMLVFYDRFAESNADNAKLQWETAKAHRRVGDIQQRLARYEDASASYEEALWLYEQLDVPSAQVNQWSAEVAIVHNELGRIEMAQGNGDSAREAHEVALVLLESVPEAERSEAQLLELARTHNLRGLAMTWGPEPGRGGFPQFRRGRNGRGIAARNRSGQRGLTGRVGGRGGGRNARGRGQGRGGGQGRATNRRRGPRGSQLAVAEHREALQIVEALLEKSPDNPELRLAQARAHRLLAGAMRFSEAASARSSRDRAIALLRQLVREFPDANHYRFELAETLVTGYARRGSRDREVLDEAISISQDLVEQNPTIPEYRASLARARLQLGSSLWSDQERATDEERATAEEHMREALRQESELAALLPDLDDHLVRWSNNAILVYRSLSDHKPAEALELLRTTAEELSGHLGQPTTSRRTGWAVAGVFRELARAFDLAGEPEAAALARQRASELSPRR